MKAFRYGRDLLALAAAALYAVNRGLLKPHVTHGFLHDHFNDVLFVPAALPLVLWIQRQVGLRRHDRPPTWGEIGLHLIVWSVVCEGLGPAWFHRGTADPGDVAAYAAGALLAGLWWQSTASSPRVVAARGAHPG